MGYRLLRRPWRAKRPLYWGMLPELAGIVPLLVLFGVAQPDAYRTLFWRIGHDYKLNSSPNMLLYAYANFRPLPHVPFVWTKTYVLLLPFSFFFFNPPLTNQNDLFFYTD